MTQQDAPTKQLKGRLRRKVITDSVCAAMCPLLQQLTLLLEGSVDVFRYMCCTKLWVLLVQYAYLQSSDSLAILHFNIVSFFIFFIYFNRISFVTT